MKHLMTGLLLVCALAINACGSNPASPSALTSAAPTGVSLDRAAAKNSEQVVFSGVTSSGTIGFWIWCEAESENPYAGECNGAMYFYNLGLTKHVEGEVTEGQEGVYTMVVSSTLDSTVSCTLTNSLPIVNGPRNTVTVNCTKPSASGVSNSAVVNVTGPQDE